MRSVAVIPARGGSKRIPGKNAKGFHGRPLIAYAIETVLESGIVDRVVVSTDDDNIANVAIASGAEVPFRRPDKLSDDYAGTGAVVRHAIETLEAQTSLQFDYVALVYPAAVFITPDDLLSAKTALISSSADFVFSATSFPAPIERALTKDRAGFASMVAPAHLLSRSQDLPDHFHDVGQFYIGRRDAWVDAMPVLTSRSVIYEIPRWRVQDIDTQEDWVRAELLYQLVHGPQN